MYKVKVKSRHESHDYIRQNLPLLPFLGVVRFGSVTEVPGAVECNTITAIKTAMDKRLMKHAFDKHGVIHAPWLDCDQEDFGSGVHEGKNGKECLSIEAKVIDFPVVIKNPLGSGGTGVYLFKSKDRFDVWWEKRKHDNYIAERFFDFAKEYRLNCTQDKCIIATRKVLKPGETKNTWKKGGDNCVWLGEDNENFEKPNNWDDIVKQSCLAVKAIGLDIGGVDVKVQKNYDKNGKFREAPEFFVIETNSAPSTFGNKTQAAFMKAIIEILKKKAA